MAWAAPGRRGALLAGFIVLIAGKAGGLGRGEPGAGLERLWKGRSEGESAAAASGASGACGEPGRAPGAASPRTGQHGVAVGWRQRDVGLEGATGAWGGWGGFSGLGCVAMHGRRRVPGRVAVQGRTGEPPPAAKSQESVWRG